ncbi:MAG: HDIG domain-containing protein [Armatimonadota bacterium]|nr:HDIG domain-containing protein [Armatimonadota bacterium]MDR5696752.1 HDIG domain-containing protein [Armatimonadota bacterium]
MDREAAYRLMCEWTQNPNLRKHMLAVEAAMRAYARRFGADEEAWGIVGLLHDFDYERHPSPEAGHPFVGVAELRRRGVPEEWCRAILSHADYSGVARESLMEKALFACDELTGFIVAVALVRGRSLANTDVESVKKKMRDKAFARAVNRDDIVRGAADLGVPLDDHIALVIRAMATVAGQLGLEGPAI